MESIEADLPPWKQVLPGEDFLLGKMFGRELVDQFQDLSLLKALDVKTMMVYLPLVLSHLEGLLETMDDTTCMEQSTEFLKLLICQHRPLKFRFLTLITQGLHKKAWNVSLLFRSDAYEATRIEFEALDREFLKKHSTAHSSVAEALQRNSSYGSSYVSCGYEEVMEDPKVLTAWTESVFFHPKTGIQLKDHMIGLRKITDCFSENACVLYIGHNLRGAANRDRASEVGKKMETLGLIKKESYLVPGGQFGLGKNVYKQTSKVQSTGAAIQKKQKADSGRVSVVSGDDSADLQMRDSELGDANTLELCISVYVDHLDLQSLSFWRDWIWTRPLEEKTDYGWAQVVHPFVALGVNELDQGESSIVHSNYIMISNSQERALVGSRVFVNKVFSSVARPGILSVQTTEEGVNIAETVSSFSQDAFLSFEPKVLVKAGDDLLQDMSVELMFRLFNFMWRVDRESFPDPEKVPYSYVYDVMPTGHKQGLMEVLTEVRPLNHYDWGTWVAERGSKSAEIRDMMLRSAAGSFVAAYVLGARDRHWDNIMVKNGSMLLHIDFGFVLGSTPPIDGPRFSISPDMEKAFTDVGIWNDFVELCGKAFTSLRRNAIYLVREVFLLFRHTGLKQSSVLKYMASKDSLDASAKDFESAEEYVCQQVRTASRQWATFMRSFAHDKVDPVYYKMLEAKFPPALLANAIIEAKEKKKHSGVEGATKGADSPGVARTSTGVAPGNDQPLSKRGTVSDKALKSAPDVMKLSDKLAAAFPFAKKK
ncbi:Phosphatidylinositol 3-kinase 1 [Porphyridium purpureum]|uniref:Phosphatidylinositol 3-kinase 1 n=1 Tax=Porphyridium purpureum TaxID=35688 RepID=A0A5J4YWQ8_PORPP|nr:Phosphatidylinositol 3-kinase 1 [Porphyridium purpureum]|eukprot:POR7232..scf209_3